VRGTGRSTPCADHQCHAALWGVSGWVCNASYRDRVLKIVVVICANLQYTQAEVQLIHMHTLPRSCFSMLMHMHTLPHSCFAMSSSRCS
jgi:hypothetical protein